MPVCARTQPDAGIGHHAARKWRIVELNIRMSSRRLVDYGRLCRRTKHLQDCIDFVTALQRPSAWPILRALKRGLKHAVGQGAGTMYYASHTLASIECKVTMHHLGTSTFLT